MAPMQRDTAPAPSSPGAPVVPRPGGVPSRSGGGGDPVTLREWLPLLGLTFSAFIFNTSEFMPMGLLTDIGDSFRMSEAQTGVMITMYAWAVMALSLPLMIWASRFEYKRLLLAVVAVFAAGQALTVVAPSFAVLVGARLVVACAHAVFWSIASPMAVRAVSPSHHPVALSMLITGTSVAMILGLPLGRVIGLALGWRMTFLCVAVAAAVVLAYLAVVFPKMPADEPFTLRRLPGLLHNRVLVGIYLVIFLLACGYYVAYSYVEPFMLQVASMPAGEVTAALTVFGVAGIAGSLLFARFYDGRRRLFVLGALAGMTAALALLLPAAGVGAAAVVATCMLWGLSATLYNVSLQGEALKVVTPEASAVAMSIYSGIFNLGIGGGSAIGGLVTDHLSIAYVGLAGAAVCLVALVYTAARLLPMMGRRG